MSASREFDVIVVGCGGAGLSAALAAQEKGARVCILERASREEAGGNTRYTGAWLRMKSMELVSEDFEEHFAENAGGYLDPDVVAETSRDRESWDRSDQSSECEGERRDDRDIVLGDARIGGLIGKKRVPRAEPLHFAAPEQLRHRRDVEAK